jgi:hypothetical protein
MQFESLHLPTSAQATGGKQSGHVGVCENTRVLGNTNKKMS